MGGLSQEVLEQVNCYLPEFDPVCMATALHTMASLRAPATSYKSLETNMAYKNLLLAIGELFRLLTLLSTYNQWSTVSLHYSLKILAVPSKCEALGSMTDL